MISQENLNKMYDLIIEGKDLTTKELNSCGFNFKDLSDLINDGVIERVSRGHYSLIVVDGLYSYGKKLKRKKEYDKSKVCFEECYKLNPNYKDVCLELFVENIYDSKYDKAFEYFEVFYMSDTEYQNNANFYLYLLHMITDVPEKHKKFAKFIRLEDVKVNHKDVNIDNMKIQNKIRLEALNEKFVTSLNLLKRYPSHNFNDVITKILLNKAIFIQRQNNNMLLEMIRDEDYRGAISFLELKDEKRSLRYADTCVLNLLNKLIDVKENNVIPEKKIFDTINLFEAIDAENYELALSLYNSDEKRKKETENPMYLLLCKITDEIQKNINFKTYMKEKIDVNQIESIVTTINCNIFEDMMRYLKKQDLHGCFRTLKTYLESIDKGEYEFLIVNLIQIDILQKDVSFSRTFNVLNDLQQDTFNLDISEYVRDFHIFISQKHYEEAKLCLDIISKMKDLVESEFLVEVLEYTLMSLSVKFDNKKNNLNTMKEELSVSKNAVEKQSILFFQKPEVEYDDDSFVNSKLEDLYRDGIVLLSPMNNERRKGIHFIIDGIPDVVSFSVGQGNERRVVLKYEQYDLGEFDKKQLVSDAAEAYQNGVYETVIEINRKLLATKNPRASVYAFLGLSYMKLLDIPLAIEYLTIATEVSKLEDNKYNFIDLIAKLKGRVKISKNDKKHYVKMSPDEFVGDVHDYYEIPNAEEILDLVSSGISIEEACNMYNLTDEYINIIYLILAKKCYAEERYISGDNYFKVVEKSPNKTDFVKWLLNEVRKNKKFYKNRVEVIQRQYTIN